MSLMLHRFGLCGKTYYTATKRAANPSKDAIEISMRRTIGLTMTPKLRLNDEDKNPLLSWIRKLRFPGILWTNKSIQMILEPTTQAVQYNS